MKRPTEWLEAAEAIQCGTHSGIPPCCIGWFVVVWLRWSADKRARYSTLWEDPEFFGPPQYIPGPRCLERGLSGLSPFIELRSCACQVVLGEIGDSGLLVPADKLFKRLEAVALEVKTPVDGGPTPAPEGGG